MRWTLSTVRPLLVNQFTRISFQVHTAFLAENRLPGQASFFFCAKKLFNGFVKQIMANWSQEIEGKTWRLLASILKILVRCWTDNQLILEKSRFYWSFLHAVELIVNLKTFVTLNERKTSDVISNWLLYLKALEILGLGKLRISHGWI